MKTGVLVYMCKAIGKFLKQTSELAILKPHMDLVGSIAEETRLNNANEIDVTITFKALEDGRTTCRERGLWYG